MTTLITPARAKELRREAHRHAAGILRNALTSWDPDHYFPDEAERDLVTEEVDAISRRLAALAIVGTYQPCAECGIPYRIKANGTVHHHNGIAPNGYSSGDPCPGVGKPPRSHTA